MLPILRIAACIAAVAPALQAAVPLAEHPRPDFQRKDWMNLNGRWSFRFDKTNAGETDAWPAKDLKWFNARIVVPFPWGSKLSGVKDGAEIAWYARTFRVPDAWKGKKVYLVIGACDWETKAWLNGRPVGSHRGGYTPFEFDLTPGIGPERDQRLVLRVDDVARPFKLEGKQGYGNARGIWQTVYLEARPAVAIDSVRFLPDIDAGKVDVRAALSEPAPSGGTFTLEFRTGGVPKASAPVAKGAREVAFAAPIPGARLWSLDDPFLYEVDASLSAGDGPADRVETYFGMRKVSVEKIPGLGHPYIALNGKPVYLQMTLDQAYHPEGFYAFPSDDFMREEILRSRRIGINAIRVHVKVEVPRKLYWADRLGLLVMEDVPNSWGEPTPEMRAEIETALRGMVRRDFNHPAIFSWVTFNETWGLGTKDKGYLPETQEWVASVWRLAKELDPTRLVEDNSPCNHDHVATDINSWHAYLPGWAWKEHLDGVVRDTAPGSKWNFIGGRAQGAQPLLNSECGNVWGYSGSTGDVDWSWDYHIMMNEFRRHPKICGWLYTEHHDVINEWNGYYRFDRSQKVTGLGGLVPGMSLRDLHAPFSISPGIDLCAEAKPGEKVKVPLWASFLADVAPARELVLDAELSGWDDLGDAATYGRTSARVPFEPWMSREIEPIEVAMPAGRAVAVLALALKDPSGTVLARNFTTFHVSEGPTPRDAAAERGGRKLRMVRIDPKSFREAKWTLGNWEVLEGLKVNGAGSGYFEYRLPWPEGLDPEAVEAASFRAEVSAKKLHTKDRAHAPKQDGDYMRGKGTADPSLNPNSYPMTDTDRFPSAVRVRLNGRALGVHDLEDDPADHRGILSWRSQKRDRKLREAGSYGYLIEDSIPREALLEAARAKEIVLRLEVDPSLPGGLAIYGELFGRYPLDPTLTFVLK